MVRVSFFINPNPAFDRMELLIVEGQMTEDQTELLPPYALPFRFPHGWLLANLTLAWTLWILIGTSCSTSMAGCKYFLSTEQHALIPWFGLEFRDDIFFSHNWLFSAVIHIHLMWCITDGVARGRLTSNALIYI